MEIGTPVLEMEDFLRVFTIYGRGCHLGHVTHMQGTNFHSPYPKKLHIKIGFDWASGFGKKRCLKLFTTDGDDGRTPYHEYPISSHMSLANEKETISNAY